MIKYSQQNNHPANAPEFTNANGALNLAAGPTSIWADVAGTFDLFKDGNRPSTFFPHTENSAPYDMNGTNGQLAIMYPFTAGNWKLDFTPRVGAKVSITFTVGTTTTPPANEPILEEYIENGTHYVVKTASGTYKAAVTKI